MSFCQRNETIKEGDTVIIYISFNKIFPLKVTKGLSHTTKYGSFKHTELIGKKYGTKFECKHGSVYLLHGSPELWTLCLPHRTQILYTPNISFITLQLDLKPGSVVIESGTGSASLSHALIRTIYPNGRLHTFEFHAQRAETARNEFLEHGMSEYVTVYNRDVCNDGFNLENVADAVFLDLPSPWKALESAKKAIKKEGGRICTFSPCIEQVQKSCLELTKLGFTDIQTVESLRRILCVKKYEMQEFNFNMDWRPVRPSGEATTAGVEEKKEAAAAAAEDETTNQKRKEPTTDNNNKSADGKKKKKIKRGKNNDSDNDDDDSSDEEGENGGKTIYTAKAINLQPGHTGFLTFATLLPKDVFS